jgi:hypothetical protein
MAEPSPQNPRKPHPDAPRPKPEGTPERLHGPLAPVRK